MRLPSRRRRKVSNGSTRPPARDPRADRAGLGFAFRGHQRGEGPAEHLGGRVAEDPLGRGVPVGDPPVQVLAHDRVVGGLDDGGEAMQRGVGLRRGGKVGRDLQHRRHAAGRVAAGRPGGGDIEAAAIGGPLADAALPDAVAFQRGADDGFRIGRRRYRAGRRRAGPAPRRPTSHRGARRPWSSAGCARPRRAAGRGCDRTGPRDRGRARGTCGGFRGLGAWGSCRPARPMGEAARDGSAGSPLTAGAGSRQRTRMTSPRAATCCFRNDDDPRAPLRRRAGGAP